MFTATSGAIDRTRRAGSRSALGYGYPSTSAVALKDVACRGWRCGRREEASSVGALVSTCGWRSVDVLLSRRAARMISVVGSGPLKRLVASSCAQSDGECLARVLQSRVEAASNLGTTDSALTRSFALVSPHIKGRAQVEDLLLTFAGIACRLFQDRPRFMCGRSKIPHDASLIGVTGKAVADTLSSISNMERVLDKVDVRLPLFGPPWSASACRLGISRHSPAPK